MSKIKVGVIGSGHMGQYHVNVLSTMPCVELTGILDTDMEKASVISTKYNIKSFENMENFLKNIDACIVSTPTVTHFEIAKKALKAGKHVLIEKPIAESVKNAEELVELADKEGLVLQVGHLERFNGAVAELRNNIIQKPYLIEARRLSPKMNRIKDVGVVLDIMIHDIDIALSLVHDQKVKKVHASGSKVFTEYEDVAAALIEFDGGCIADLKASRVTDDKIRTLSVSQEGSYVFLDYSTQDIRIHRQPSSEYMVNNVEIKYSQESLIERVFIHKDNPLKLELEHFADCIRDKAKPYVTGEMDIMTLKVAMEICREINI
jgi:predicted dehydrogenase